MQARRTIAKMEESLKEGALIRQLSSDVLALEMLKGELLRRNRQLSGQNSGPMVDLGGSRIGGFHLTSEVRVRACAMVA